MDKIFLLMSRAVTLFTGQWADLPLAKLLPLVKKMGYDGVELACWGDHFEVDRALAEFFQIKYRTHRTAYQSLYFLGAAALLALGGFTPHAGVC